MSFRPYLFFGGNCHEAFTRYREIFGGRLDVMTFADAPPEAVPPGGRRPDPAMVMHAALIPDDGDMLMASDDPTGAYDGMRGFSISHTAKDAADAQRIFAALSEGGSVMMPLGPTFWAPLFGMCTDRFGTGWMIDVASEEAAEG
ncbi:MAG: VOC family protein [Thermoleophilia bacterium]|jgi:PhnB protein